MRSVIRTYLLTAFVITTFSVLLVLNVSPNLTLGDTFEDNICTSLYSPALAPDIAVIFNPVYNE